MSKNIKKCWYCRKELQFKYSGYCEECEQDLRRKRDVMIPMSNGYRVKVIPAGFSDGLNNDDDN